MIAAQVARELKASSVIVPQSPGEFSAFGLLASDLRVTRATSPMTVLVQPDHAVWEQRFKDLENAVATDLGRQGAEAEDVVYERAIFVMYTGQTWDNRLEVSTEPIDEAGIKVMQQQVHDFYELRYGFSAEEVPILITTIEVTGRVARTTGRKTVAEQVDGDPVIRRVRLRLGGTVYEDAAVYARVRMRPGYPVPGPALIVEDYATTVVLPGSQAYRDDKGNLRLVPDKEELS
jgi:N-methylhydantoinase A